MIYLSVNCCVVYTARTFSLDSEKSNIIFYKRTVGFDIYTQNNDSLLLHPMDIQRKSQYVTCDDLKTIFQVSSGAGMGMLASGHVDDAVFYYMVEAPFALAVSTPEKYGLFFYARFKDDIFLVFDAKQGIERMRDFITEFRRRSGPFIIKMESVSRHGCQMLDMFVSVGPTGTP